MARDDPGHGGELRSQHFYRSLGTADLPADLQAQGFLDYRWFAASPHAVVALAKRGQADDWAAYIAGVPAGANLEDAILFVWGSAAKLPENLATVLFPDIAASGLRYRP